MLDNRSFCPCNMTSSQLICYCRAMFAVLKGSSISCRVDDIHERWHLICQGVQVPAGRGKVIGTFRLRAEGVCAVKGFLRLTIS